MTALDSKRQRGSPWPAIDERAGQMTREPVVRRDGGRSEHWVYLWHWPIRAMHWAAAREHRHAPVVTGFWIGRPYFLTGGASQTFGLQYVRLVHFIAAGVLVATAIVRVYWLFAGDRFERLPALFPVRKRDWVNLWKTVKFYLLIHPERSPALPRAQPAAADRIHVHVSRGGSCSRPPDSSCSARRTRRASSCTPSGTSRRTSAGSSGSA